jgi:hypothetical protein
MDDDTMDDQDRRYAAAANDANAEAKAFRLPKSGWQQWAFAVLAVGAYAYFDVGTRWNLAGTWDCNQYNNGAQTRETFGFFGHRATYNASGPESGVNIIGSYSLDGKVLATRPDRAERDGVTLMAGINKGKDIVFRETIKNLRGDELLYLLHELDANRRTAMISCRKR